MVFSLPARLLCRVDQKTAVLRLSFWLQWLRLLEFAATAAFLGIFLDFALGLPDGFEASRKMTAVYALSIVATIYPILFWLLWLILRAKKRSVLQIRISRMTDSLLAAPILMATAVVLGNAGLPSECTELYRFDSSHYAATASNATAQPACDILDARNECGTGFKQLGAVAQKCAMVKAGFGLVIATTVTVYLIILLANLYLFYQPNDRCDLNDPRGHRRGPSFRNGRSESTQHLTDMSQIGSLPAAHIAGDSVPAGEPPPPYTSRPGNNERLASADELQRSHMLSRITTEMTMASSLGRTDTIRETEQERTSIGDHPVFNARRTDSVLNQRTSQDSQRRAVTPQHPRLVTQSSSGALSSRASLGEARDPVSPLDEDQSPTNITTAGMTSESSSSSMSPLSPLSPVSAVEDRIADRGSGQANRLAAKKKQATSDVTEVPRDTEIASQERRSQGHEVTVTAEEPRVSEASDLRESGSNASLSARVDPGAARGSQ